MDAKKNQLNLNLHCRRWVLPVQEEEEEEVEEEVVLNLGGG